MGRYTACFDASGKEDSQQHIVVAGFLSTANHWLEFSRQWQERLQQDNLPFLHMKLFAHKKRPFHNLSDSQRKSLLTDLLEVIAAYQYRYFAIVVDNTHIRQHLSKEAKQQLYLNSYSYAARTAVARMSIYLKSQRMDHTPLELVFEKGDVGEGMLRDRLIDDGYPNPQFRYPKDTKIGGTVHPGFIPLQASDFLAYEVFKFAKDNPAIIRKPLERFLGMVGEIRECTPENLKETEQWMLISEYCAQRFSDFKKKMS